MPDMATARKNSKGKKHEDWEISSALDTLQRAQEIKANPEMMVCVKELAKKRLQEIALIAGEVNK